MEVCKVIISLVEVEVEGNETTPQNTCKSIKL